MLSTHQQIDAPLDEPKVIGVLENIDGGQFNLLATSALSKDVRVEFPQWHNSEPSEQNPEYLELVLNDDSVERKQFTSHPIPSSDLYINLPSDSLREGSNFLLYKVTSYTGDEYGSDSYRMTVDLTPPELAFNDEPLIDPAIIQDGLTEQYLIDHDGTLQVNIPAHIEPEPGNRVIMKYLNVNNGEYKELVKVLDRDNQYDPTKFELAEALIREMGDGPHTISYEVEDRAGNPSKTSKEVEFLVAVIRPPRVTPHPWVVQAEGSPSQYADLNPDKTVSGATGQIPEEANYYDDDRVVFQFGERDALGSISLPVPWGVKEVKIPAPNIAAYFGKSVPVYYELTLPDATEKKSEGLTLAIGNFAATKFPVPQLQSPFSDPVSKASIPSTGLPVHQRNWVYISVMSLVTITVSGRDTQGQSVSRIVLDKHQVTQAQVTDGVRVNLPKDFITSLAINSRFTVETKVSFNGGERWTTFIHLKPNLLA
ncbi:hypothetical protein HNO86_16945 [Pseudomonas sp. C1C7]|uniref:hypothetical protein n=1 Tax=Pseudomonas sp. C1C7 TaxID=2735272 RepID=UPI001586EF57|nr:hypothetical protein [Pseudomonas sp. C1C7]NUT76734.1 hypothetical protein [Pseudomonas sp. C1C7]